MHALMIRATQIPGKSRVLARVAGAVALSALLAACSSGATRFDGGHTGSTGPATSGSDAVMRSSVPPAEGFGEQRRADHGAYQMVPETGDTGYRAATTVTVKPGQTLFSIAREHGVSVGDVAAANDIAAPFHVNAGQQLRIPSGGGSPQYAVAGRPGAAPEAASAPATRPSHGAGGGVHEVRPGETLYSLGRSYNVSPMDIARHNRLSEPYHLRAGQAISIPGSAGDGRVAARPSPPRENAAPAGNQTDDARQASAGEQPSDSRSARQQVDTRAHEEMTRALPEPAQRTATNFRWPVRGRVISEFGPRPNGSRNDGINIAVPEGTSVRAAENGVVAYAGNELRGYGNLVLIRHADGWVTAYAHNSELLVKRGDEVRRGDIIAKAGQTGSVTSPQLHFELRKGAQAVDPMPHLDASLASN